MRQTSTKFIIVVVAVLLILAAIPYFFSWVCPPCSLTLTRHCHSNLQKLALMLDYQKAIGSLPSSQHEFEELCRQREQWQKALICPFDERKASEKNMIYRKPLLSLFKNKKSCSYVYVPPSQKVVDSEGKQVILYCTANHPSVVYASDGDKGNGFKSVVRPNLKVETVKSDESFKSISDINEPNEMISSGF